MTNEQALTLLKFIAPVVALFAAVWSTTQKITYDDENGVKRLTVPGRVMIGIGFASTLITVLALGLEIYVQRDKASATQAAAATERLLRAEEKTRDKASAEASDQRKALAALAAEARIQQDFVRSRIQIAEAAAAQQQRDATLSLQVAREANRRLAEAERTLAELDRINNPLRSITVTFTVALDFTGVDMTQFWTRLATRADYPRPPPVSREYRPYEMRLAADQLRGQEIFDYGIGSARPVLAFRPPSARAAVPGPPTGTLTVVEARRDAVVLIVMRPGVDRVAIDVRDKTIVATYTATENFVPEGTLKSGEKMSVADFRRLIPLLTVRRVSGLGHVAPRPPDRLTLVTVRVNDQPWFGAAADQPFDTEVVLELR